MGLFSKKQRYEYENDNEENEQNVLEELRDMENKETFGLEIFEETSTPIITISASTLLPNGSSYIYKELDFNEINEKHSIIDVDRRKIDKELFESNFSPVNSNIENVFYEDLHQEFISPANVIIEQIHMKDLFFKTTEKGRFYRMLGKSVKRYSNTIQIILICRQCIGIPIAEITHFRQQDGSIRFYCEAHKKSLESNGKEFALPIEQFLENFPNRDNAKIITRMKDFSPTILEYSSEFEPTNKRLMNIQAEKIDIKIGEVNNIDEQLAKNLENKREQWVSDRLKELGVFDEVNEKSDNEKNESLTEDENIEDSTRETEDSNIKKDDYAMETINYLKR